MYALGVLLYLLLTGRRPYDVPGRSPGVVERNICDVEPPRPSSVVDAERGRRLRGDLDAIVLKALRKEPGRRYPSAAALQHDLDRCVLVETYALLGRREQAHDSVRRVLDDHYQWAGSLNYLPSSGGAGRLTADVLNPTSTSSGVFGGELLALQLNVVFADPRPDVRYGQRWVRSARSSPWTAATCSRCRATAAPSTCALWWADADTKPRAAPGPRLAGLRGLTARIQDLPDTHDPGRAPLPR